MRHFLGKRKNLLTGGISEIGFVRILSGPHKAKVPAALCKHLLAKMVFINLWANPWQKPGGREKVYHLKNKELRMQKKLTFMEMRKDFNQVRETP